MVVLWKFSGISKECLCHFHWISMRFLWDFYGISIFLLDFYDISLGVP